MSKPEPGHPLPIVVREATPDDALPLLAYVHGMLAEPGIDLIMALLLE